MSGTWIERVDQLRAENTRLRELNVELRAMVTACREFMLEEEIDDRFVRHLHNTLRQREVV